VTALETDTKRGAGDADTVMPARFVTRRRRQFTTVVMLLAADAAALLGATLAATQLRFGSLFAPVSFENTGVDITFWELSLVLSVIWLVFIAAEGLYDIEQLFWGAGELRRVARALALGIVGFILVTFLLKTPGMSRAWTLLSWMLAVLFVWAGRLLVRLILHRARARGALLRRTLIVGSNAEAADLIGVLRSAPETGLVPVGCLAATQADRLALDYTSTHVPVLGSAREIAAVVDSAEIDTVIIATSAFEHDVVSRMIAELRGKNVSIQISSGLFEVLTTRVWVREVAGIPIITVKGVSLSRFNLCVKRVFDIAVASLGVLVGLPLWIAVAMGIVLTSKGPVFYRQERIGQHGKPFRMYKFRSMVADADARLAEVMASNEASGPMFKMRRDPRVTAVGTWMRKFSIDEFPQLINVLKGEMSLVGPRPPLPSEVVQYTEHDWRRLEVPPGMTGLWQVSGRSSLTFAEMVRLDLFYIENWSVPLDVSLILRTIPAVLLTKGAY
jgi:exopolysaccharide biosynthesis polyprenyl glycosylphosphotransferase